jgi:hypothetical protein
MFREERLNFVSIESRFQIPPYQQRTMAHGRNANFHNEMPQLDR